jgi:integrase
VPAAVWRRGGTESKWLQLSATVGPVRGRHGLDHAQTYPKGGSIIKRGSTYSVVLDLGRGPDGKRQRKWHSGYRTRKDAERARVELLARIEQGSYVEPSRLTVAGFLLEQWLPSLAGQVRPTTLHGYRTNLERYVLPALGGLTLQHLTPAHLNTLYGSMLAHGGKGGRPLSARTVQAIHMTLRKALGDAARWGMIVRNVAELASPPRPRRVEMQTWTAEELRTFLEHVEGQRLYAVWILTASTGMRRGEVLGLRWRDVDLDRARASVRQTLVLAGRQVVTSEPKTSRGRRSIALDPRTVSALSFAFNHVGSVARRGAATARCCRVRPSARRCVVAAYGSVLCSDGRRQSPERLEPPEGLPRCAVRLCDPPGRRVV